MFHSLGRYEQRYVVDPQNHSIFIKNSPCFNESYDNESEINCLSSSDF